MAEETVDEEVKAEKPPKKPSTILNMLLIVLLALGSSAGGGVLSWYLLSKTIAHGESDKKAEGEEGEHEEMAEILEKGAVMPLEPFVVNLADTEVATLSADQNQPDGGRQDKSGRSK